MPRLRPFRLLSRLRPAARRRGALGATIAVSSAALFGMAGLAIEGGNWLLTRRNAQNAADMAALVAARLLDGSRDVAARGAAVAAAQEVAARNGFVHGANGATVTVNLDAGGNEAAVEVIVSRDVGTVLTRLIPAVGNTVTPAGRAVGATFRTQDVCILADRPDGVDRAGQPTQVRYKSTDDHRYVNCVVHANSPDRGPLNGSNEYRRGIVIDSINSNALRTDGLRTTDSRCGKIESTATGDACGFVASSAPFTGSVRPVSNPYAYLDSLAAPVCTSRVSGSVDFAARTEGSMRVLTPGVYCPLLGQRDATITLKEGAGATMVPGTYYFRGVNLTIEISGSLNCFGCTFVFLDSPLAETNPTLRGRPGALWVKGTQLSFHAPALNTDNSALNGMLFVRLSDGYLLDGQAPSLDNLEGRADGSSLGPNFGARFESAQNLDLRGGQYYGQSALWIKSSTTGTLSPCNPIVSGIVFFDSSDDWVLRTDGCPTFNTPVAGIRGTRLIR